MQLLEPMCKARIVVVKSDPPSAVSFPHFLKDNWQKMIVDHSELTIVHCSSGTIATCPVFPEKQMIICLEVLRARTTFVAFGSS